jgi:enterochelin esterase family protein
LVKVAAVLAGLASAVAMAQPRQGNPGAQQRVPPVKSPEVQADGAVIFRLRAPDAKTVGVNGEFLASGQTLEAVKNDQGIWEAKTAALPSDMYVYNFVVDGVRALDPSNPAVVRDGSWVENHVTVPGPLADLLDVKDVPHGRVTALWYPSPTIGMSRRMLVYTPPGYEKGSEKYPVLYLFHGSGGDEEGWINRGRANTFWTT